jgi:hypothetical protein
MIPQKKKYLTFAELVSSIRQAHDLFSAQASKAVNIGLTLRNWFIGMYITEYELHGADRAGYGENLFNELAAKLAQHNVSGCRFRQLYNYRAFYRAYPQILRTVSAKLADKCPVPPKRDRRGQGAQLKRYFLFGKPRPVARELHNRYLAESP